MGENFKDILKNNDVGLEKMFTKPTDPDPTFPPETLQKIADFVKDIRPYQEILNEFLIPHKLRNKEGQPEIYSYNPDMTVVLNQKAVEGYYPFVKSVVDFHVQNLKRNLKDFANESDDFKNTFSRSNFQAIDDFFESRSEYIRVAAEYLMWKQLTSSETLLSDNSSFSRDNRLGTDTAGIITYSDQSPFNRCDFTNRNNSVGCGIIYDIKRTPTINKVFSEEINGTVGTDLIFAKSIGSYNAWLKALDEAGEPAPIDLSDFLLKPLKEENERYRNQVKKRILQVNGVITSDIAEYKLTDEQVLYYQMESGGKNYITPDAKRIAGIQLELPDEAKQYLQKEQQVAPPSKGKF